ncbi:MAG: TIGR01777 family protein [Acidobacteria bacterium]|nr:TIGR01777 family protein [Acidobacteriota bacterium]MYA45469.1 TIGR01777 family protein [Acidobacteriota bacterium]MYI39117.1 TIGR01777 family protein [Acidobacteriota bacterium]
MRIGITGATGLIGGALASELAGRGHEVVALTRSARTPGGLPPGVGSAQWNPGGDGTDAGLVGVLEGLDSLVHLAGEPVGKRWTAARKRAIRESRVAGTKTLVAALRAAPRRPARLLAASAVGYYGPRGDEELDEDALPGTDFLAEVCTEWEDASAGARQAGVETVLMRIGVVLSPRGGALATMLPPFRMGVGGRVGSGRQWMPWIHLADVAAAMVHLLEAPAGSLEPVYNLTAPNPVTNADFTSALGKALRRPTVLPVPGFGMQLAFGEMAGALLLSGQRVVPRRLLASGFEFRHPEIRPALTDLVGN